MEKNRWWENYTVRYLPGTFFSFFIIYLLSHKNLDFTFNTGLKKSMGVLFENAFKGNLMSIVLLGCVSFVFCYLSSAIILIAHTFRFFLFSLFSRGNNISVLEGYGSIAKFRAAGKNGDKSKSEIVESYRYLREHGNAFFCVLTSLFAGWYISVCDKIFFILGLLIILVFGITAWYWAIKIEVDCIKKN